MKKREDKKGNGPTTDQIREQFRFAPFIKLGRLALFNELQKRVIDGQSPTLLLIQKTQPHMFEDMVKNSKLEFIR